MVLENSENEAVDKIVDCRHGDSICLLCLRQYVNECVATPTRSILVRNGDFGLIINDPKEKIY